MDESAKSCTLLWKIKNFSFFLNKTSLRSPTFVARSMNETKWTLSLYSKYCIFKDCLSCYFRREIADHGPNEYKLDYELCFLANDGSVLHSEKYVQKEYIKGHTESPLYIKREEILMHETNDDVLTIRCRMWNRQKPIAHSERCFAETRIETECQTLTGTIKTFSNTVANAKNPVFIQSSLTEIFLSYMNLYVVTNGKLVIELELVNKSIERYSCKIFIKDVFGNKVKAGQGKFYNANPQCINLPFTKEYLIENQFHYLPDDVLTTECEITFSINKTTVKVDESKYEFYYEDTQKISNSMKTNFTLKEYGTEGLTTLMDDLVLLFNEGILYDMTLKTATETFPAHTIILSARSSVFKSMLTTDMKEKNNHCVDIDDLNADTVRQMLSFMYFDTLDDLEYESAKSLYFAADKYNIVSMKRRCSNYLKQNLQQSNCCGILLLADKHQDKDLKNAVQDYIAENDDVVLFSDEWKNLAKNHPQLTIEVLMVVYMKNRKR